MKIIIYIYPIINNIVDMKKLFNIFLLVPLLVACDQMIDQNYDIEKLDSEMTIGGGFTVSISNFDKSLILKDLLEGNSIIVEDSEGNYKIKMDTDEQSFELDVPAISLDQINVPIEVNFDALAPVGPSGDVVIPEISYEKIAGGSVSFVIEKTSFPEEITALVSANIKNGGSINLTFMPKPLSGAKFYLLKETTITFPEIIQGLSCNNADFSFEGNVLKVVNDREITDGLSLPISFVSLQVPDGQGVVAAKHLRLSGEVAYNIGVRVSYAGLLGNIQGYEPGINGNMKIAQMNVQDATLKLYKELSLDDLPSATIGELPEMLSGENANLDLHDLELKIGINNNFPAAFKLSSKLAAFKSDGSTTHEFTLGPYNVVQGSNSFIINESTHAGISDILIPVPASIGLKDFNAEISTPNAITINTGASYSANASFGIDTPLAFGPEAELNNISKTIDDLDFGEDSKISFSEATFKVTYVNTIPLEFKLSARAIAAEGVSISLTDNDGNSLTTHPLSLNFSENGQEGELSIKVKGDEIKLSDLKGLNLSFSANSSEALKGKKLNKNQGIQLSSLKVVLDSGITIGGEKDDK